MSSIIDQLIKYIEKEENANASRESEEEKRQGAPQSENGDGGLMKIDENKDDYDYYESQLAKQNRMKSRAIPFGRLSFHLLLIQRTRNYKGPQYKKETGDVFATFVGYLNRDFKKIYKFSSAVSTQKYINDKYLGKRLIVQEQDLDDNVATPDNVVVFDKKKNAIYSIDGYTITKGFGDLQHQNKRNWKKSYYSDEGDDDPVAFAAKLNAQRIKCSPYMKWLSQIKLYKVRDIKNYRFRAFANMVKKYLNMNGGANLPMAAKQ
ncbi:MAG: hypothetical protein EZS28_009037 [Streblomastix strix]|uniref:Uncharacterized protein n=1 Tax=Streblomastix strix TaxID=222440 RepID=A0A5J4WM30_9EUKA|nr:MAG: hypothetical protein EZS28_009037 [Streblomastix strix]